MSTDTPDILAAFAICPVVPVITISRLETAVPLGEALAKGGFQVLEIALRTDCAIDAIRLMRKSLDSKVLIGAGTITTAEDLEQVLDAGAEFAFSPGAPPSLLQAGVDTEIPFIPGVATVTEAMQAQECGFSLLKYFPAAYAGGPQAVGSMNKLLPGLKFCPTGGITPETLNDYLDLPNVAAVGGSWMLSDYPV